MDKLLFRRATAEDLGVIVAMLADDVFGSSRESSWTCRGLVPLL